MSDAIDVLCAIDQLRRDLSGYHGQLKAHDDLQRHCDNQRKRIAELEGLYAGAKAENAKLRECLQDLAELGPRTCRIKEDETGFLDCPECGARVEETLESEGCEYCQTEGFDGQFVMMSNHGWQRINYCPNCGAKVVEE